nr:hypothetical protein [Niallia taxi]
MKNLKKLESKMNNRVKEFWLGMNFVKKVKKKGFSIEMLSKLELLLIG